MGMALSRYVPKNPFNLVWMASAFAIAGAAFLTAVQSLLQYGYISGDLLVMGTINTIIISAVIAYLIVDIVTTQRREREEELRSLLVTDELTQLHNRRGFYLLADQLMRLADRMMTPLDIMYVDLDRLKWINDTYGHDEGDAALVSVGVILKGLFRSSDVVARLGGDEFVVMRVGSAEPGTEKIRQRVAAAFQRHNDRNNDTYPLSVSTGFSRYDPASPGPLDQLLKEADGSMYREKKNKHASR